MSRSYRHNVRFPYESDKKQKKFANRKVRRSNKLYNNSDYRKVYDSWLIRLGHWGYDNEDEYIKEGLYYSDKTEEELRKQYRILRSK